MVALLGSPPCSTMNHSSQSTPWVHSGPGGYAMYDDPLKLESAGAAQAMVHVGSAWLLATANGGIWKTTKKLEVTYSRWAHVKCVQGGYREDDVVEFETPDSGTRQKQS